MLKCEISDELMNRVKQCERMLQKLECLNYCFKWQNCEPLWKEEEPCSNFGEFEIRNQGIVMLMKIFEDGHLYFEAAGERNGWIIQHDEFEKMYQMLWVSDSCFFASPGIECKDGLKDEMFLNLSYCTARIKDDYCDAGDFALIAEESLLEFLDDASTINAELFDYLHTEKQL